jgi:hypothetical protein
MSLGFMGALLSKSMDAGKCTILIKTLPEVQETAFSPYRSSQALSKQLMPIP